MGIRQGKKKKEKKKKPKKGAFLKLNHVLVPFIHLFVCLLFETRAKKEAKLLTDKARRRRFACLSHLPYLPPPSFQQSTKYKYKYKYKYKTTYDYYYYYHHHHSSSSSSSSSLKISL